MENFYKNQEKDIKEFKNLYGGGYLGYTHIHNFGNISQFIELTFTDYIQYSDNLETKLKDYLNEIPDSVTYSVIPALRWQHSNGSYHSITVTESIKITKHISRKLLAERLVKDIYNTLLEYDLRDLDIELYMMGRP
jgi:hypothetical protein